MEWRLGFRFYVFTYLSTQPTHSVGPIFLCLKKDRGERQTKGLQAALWNLAFYTGVRRGDVRRPYEFAQMQLTRFRPVRGVCKHTVSTDSIVLLRLRRIRNTYRITSQICSRKLGCCVSLAVFLSSAARRAHGSSAEHAMRDLIASHAPLRNGAHKARPVSCQH